MPSPLASPEAIPYSSPQPQGSMSVAAMPIAKQPSTLDQGHAYSVHGGRRQQNTAESPLLYMGVSLARPSNSTSWGVSLFPCDDYLVVGGIQQDCMQRFTTWAWATTVFPEIGRSPDEFRSGFGPLHPTSLLPVQLVPGDVILSINGSSAVSDMKEFVRYTQKLDIVAVRHEMARRHAQDALMVHAREYMVAQVAFRAIQPLLMMQGRGAQQQMTPPSRRVSFPPVHTITPETSSTPSGASSTESKGEDWVCLAGPSVGSTTFSTWLTKRKATWRETRAKRKACEALTMLANPPTVNRPPRDQLPRKSPGDADQVKGWLMIRKEQWRGDRAKRRRCNGTDADVMNEQLVVYTSVKLERRSKDQSWGFHLTHLDKYFLGIGHVNGGAARAHASWGWATVHPLPATVLSTTDELVIQAYFQNQPLNIGSMIRLEQGDLVVSINGIPISSFRSLSEIVEHIKECTTLLIVALRHPRAREAARVAWSHANDDADQWITALRGVLPFLYNMQSVRSMLVPGKQFKAQSRSHAASKASSSAKQVYRNPLFRDSNGDPICFEDDVEFDLDYGSRASDFLPEISSESFPSWLETRKTSWRKGWNVRAFDESVVDEDDSPCSVATDFWSPQGYPTFQHWLAASTHKWKQSYSWNRKKRAILEKECFEEVVHFPVARDGPEAVSEMRNWIRVRKQQWRFHRRKRQRRLQLEEQSSSSLSISDVQDDERPENDTESSVEPSHDETSSESATTADLKRPALDALPSPTSVIIPRQISGEMTIIDAVLDEQERQCRVMQESRRPLDISLLFDADLGVPDDVVAHCLRFLDCSEHGKLLCLNSVTSEALKQRSSMWRQLCPTHWTLPRRPRKPWHEMYITRIRQDEEASRKWSDEFLNKAHVILVKGDFLGKIEQLVEQGERRLVGFDINYTSGVVCERNSVLNLASIYSRHKVVRWLIETRKADVETSDRGDFTPLINAAWEGDRSLVRYLLSHGADRSKVGYNHFFKPLASSEFKGLTAEGWARRRGHHDLANLIRLGL